MNQYFLQKMKENKTLIVAHRGTYGGNIIENTFLSSITALNSGAHIIEIDAVKSLDGEFYAFHDGEEERRFGISKNLKELYSHEIESLEYLNIIGEKSGEYIWKLETLLSKLKGKGLINLDRAWNWLDEIFQIILKLEMENQVIIKTPPTKEAYEFFKKNKNKLMYMSIAKTKDDVLRFIDKDINMVAVELLFKKEDDEIISNEFLSFLKEKNIKTWVNSITLGGLEEHNLSAWKDDNTSLENPDKGWGWLLEKNFEIIQTDWPYLLKNYIENKKN